MIGSYYQLLKELISIQSISVTSSYYSEIERIVIYLNALLQDNGFVSQIVYGYGNPLVVGKYVVDNSLPTVLLYGHYDVQVADEYGWKQDPFCLYVTQEKIYGRGVVDNKGQFLIHLLTIFDLIRAKKMGYNVIVLLEGNEETGSQYLEQFVCDYKQDLLSDFCLISDSHIFGTMPCIDVGYRGGINLKLKITTATTDLHSGLYGGIVPNAIHEMNTIFSKLYDVHHRITIPYFYYDVEEIDASILVRHKKITIEEHKIMKDFGIKKIFKEKNLDILTQLGLRPTIQITGITGGYVGDGFKNSIPNVAYAHVNFRIVKNQSTKKVISAFDQRLRVTLPSYVDYDLEIGSMFEPVKIDTHNFYIKKAEAVLQKIFGLPVFYKYSGGSLPVVEILQRVLNITPVLIPFANEDCNVHGVNENFSTYLIEKGFQFSYEFLKK